MKKGIWIWIAVMVIWPQVASAATTGDVVTKVADRLVGTQITEGEVVGYWTGDDMYTGTIVGGLVDAYQLTENLSYKQAAEKGGYYILTSYEAGSCNFWGDEAYALMRLSQIQDNACDNMFRTYLADFYECVRLYQGGTEAYIAEFAPGTDASTAVFYLAHHTVAAWYVNAVDKEIWRSSLKNYLSHVDDDVTFDNVPVTALGVATWALAQTGPLNNSLVKMSGHGSAYWDGVVLEDLPVILQMHRCTDPVLYTGNFYWRFDHQFGVGYTEDNVYGILGLSFAQRLFPSQYDYDADIDQARAAMESAVDMSVDPWTKGYVYAHVDKALLPVARPYYAGQMLMALAAAAYPGDMDLDDDVDPADLIRFAKDWLQDTSASCTFAYKTDLNRDGCVNLVDFAILSDHWLNAR